MLGVINSFRRWEGLNLNPRSVGVFWVDIEMLCCCETGRLVWNLDLHQCLITKFRSKRE